MFMIRVLLVVSLFVIQIKQINKTITKENKTCIEVKEEEGLNV